MLSRFESLRQLSPRIVYFRVIEPHRGLTRQRNFALRWVSVDIVAFFDDDVVLAPNCLGEMERTMRSSAGEIVGVGACMVNELRRPHLRWRIRRLLRMVPHIQPGSYCRCGFAVPWAFLPASEEVVEGSYLLGCAMMWRTELARATGFYDGFSGYSSGEDLEFSLRMARHGKLVMAGSAHLEHLHAPEGRPDSYRLGYMSTANSHTIHRRCLANRSWKDIAMFAYAYSVDTLMRAAYLPAPGDRTERWRFLRGRCHFLRDLLLKRI
jgi:GT2 family glycosyltransferase